ncbi:hypothetical protein PhCBS80983_g02276 [Powellomyces hirtus]|uniref:ATP-dependent DNA helicase PIF1 n=1 Tax=Powellomyces hirtus TaxID=109895 RepID=A0A507E7A0_9FUNG|nr:hypothetical protein PhCBS80983_g02276 [Powellomyces hirtus]
MPNPHDNDLRQMKLSFAAKPGIMPKTQAGKTPAARVATGNSRFFPYTAAIKDPKYSKPSVQSEKRVASSIALKKSESGSKMVIDLTEPKNSPYTAESRREDRGSLGESVAGSLNLDKFKYPSSGGSQSSVAIRSSVWSRNAATTTMSTTIETLPKRAAQTATQAAPTTTMSTATAALHKKAGQTTMGMLAGVNLDINGGYKLPKHREVFKEAMTSATTARSAASTFRTPSTQASSANSQENKSVKSEKIELSAEQEMVAQLVLERRESIFFTGSAGTGKSVLLRELIRRLHGKYAKDEIGVTASTGIAACNINGTTLHSFAGCGIGNDNAITLARRVMGNKRSLMRWRKCKVLIVDEISMVEGDFFDKLNEMGQILRNIKLPFGGIQLVICGDFMQLPPVARNSKFAFEAQTWSKCVKRTIQLTHVFRQKDQAFIDLLNEMRVGIVSPESEQLLTSLSRDLHYSDGIEPTQLYAIRTQVETANGQRLRNLKGESRTFNAVDQCKNDSDRNKLKDMMAPLVLELKIGAQVMLIKNIDANLVNGSLGIVQGFEQNSGNPIVEFTVENKPKLMEISSESWSVEMPGVGVVASRTQIPLLLAYSMSIHKSQGQTLERVKVDLGKVFENGQAYVALSRATHLKGLQVLNYSRGKVKVDPRVVAFNKQLSRMCTQRGEYI